MVKDDLGIIDALDSGELIINSPIEFDIVMQLFDELSSEDKKYETLYKMMQLDKNRAVFPYKLDCRN